MISLNPKKRFLEMPELAEAHRELVVKDSFTIALEMALLDYQTELLSVETADSIVSEAQAQRLIGAHGFIEKLLNLAETTEVKARMKLKGEIDYRVK